VTECSFIIDGQQGLAKLFCAVFTLLHSKMNSSICPAIDSSSPQPFDRNDGRRLYLSLPERQSVESIIVAALKGGDRNPLNSNAGHGFNIHRFARPNVYTRTSMLPCHAGQYELAMLALSRTSDLLAALHLADSTASSFWRMTANVQNSLQTNRYPQEIPRHGPHINSQKSSFYQALTLLLGRDKRNWAVNSTHRSNPDIQRQTLNQSSTDIATNDFSVSQAVVDLVRYKNNEDTLTTLGSKCLERRRDKVPYFDASTLMDPDSADNSNQRRRGGILEPVPEKLYRMLIEACRDGEEGVISFFPHGRAFGM
jgi:hypothetical protein